MDRTIVKILNFYIILSCTHLSFLSSIYPLPAMHSLLVALYVAEYIIFFSSTLRTLYAAFINVLLNCSEQKTLFCYNCKDVIFTSVDNVFEDFAQVNS